MKRELRDKWVAALRSGEYQQGRRQLYHDETNSYCCLGVLACIAGHTPEQLVGYATLSGYGLLGLLGTDEPASVYEEELWRMNDGVNNNFNRSFAEIADWIELNVLVES